MKHIAILFTLFALLVGIKGADKPLVIGGSPVVHLLPCGEIKPGAAGLCVVIVHPGSDRAIAIPADRVDGFRFVPDGSVM